MVMTLRKRVAPAYAVESESESDSEEEIPNAAPTKKRRKKRRSKKEDDDEEEEISSSSDESGSESDDEEENEGAGVGYENIREQRIRENRERMEKLGIFTLTSQLFNNNNNHNNGRKSKPVKKAAAPKKKRYPPLYPRSRQSSTRAAGGQYLKSEGLLEDLGIRIPEGWKAEAYTEEDEKRLGHCEAPWTLKVDGFGDDGERLYDPDGTPCHQCRQKVVAKLTHCANCRSPHGVLCGDCLYTRYGENVFEALHNSTWSCPVCRGLCNCSRCRRAKGWDPVNIHHSKLIEKGFKSVAHYLVLTRRAGATPKDLNDGTVTAHLTTAPQPDEGSDYSAQSSESASEDSDSDDDSKAKRGTKQQSVEMQVASADMSNSNEAAVANDKDQALQDPENLETSLPL